MKNKRLMKKYGISETKWIDKEISGYCSFDELTAAMTYFKINNPNALQYRVEGDEYDLYLRAEFIKTNEEIYNELQVRITKDLNYLRNTKIGFDELQKDLDALKK